MWGALVSRRLDPHERERHEAFLAEISTTWHPVTIRERFLAWCARAVHLRVRLFDGGPTMMQAAGPAALVGMGFLLRTVAPDGHDTALRSGAPWPVHLVLAAILFGLAAEAILSPRRVRRTRMVFFLALPLGLAAICRAALMSPSSPVIEAVRLSTACYGLAALALMLAGRWGRWPAMRVAIAVQATAAVVLAISEAARIGNFVNDGDYLLAAAALFISAGIMLLGFAFYRARPDQRIPDDSQLRRDQLARGGTAATSDAA